MTPVPTLRLLFTCFVSAFVLAACGGAVSNSDTLGRDGGGVDADTSGQDGGGAESGFVCDPTGNWIVAYANPTDCIPQTNNLVVRAEDGGFVVEYDVFSVRSDVPPPSGSVSADGCTITAAAVYSMPALEDGGRVLSLVLHVEAGTARGTLTFTQFDEDPAAWFCRVSGECGATASRTAS